MERKSVNITLHRIINIVSNLYLTCGKICNYWSVCQRNYDSIHAEWITTNLLCLIIVFLDLRVSLTRYLKFNFLLNMHNR